MVVARAAFSKSAINRSPLVQIDKGQTRMNNLPQIFFGAALTLGAISDFGQSTVRFDRARYDIAPGETFPVHALIDATPAAGLSSFGVMLAFSAANGRTPISAAVMFNSQHVCLPSRSSGCNSRLPHQSSVPSTHRQRCTPLVAAIAGCMSR